MDFKSILLTALDDVPPPPDSQDLRISGCSVVFYVAHRLADIELSAKFAAGALDIPSDDRSYESKVRLGSGLLYSQFIDAGPVPAAFSRLIGSSHATRLNQSIVSFGEEYAISVIPFLLSRPQGNEGLGIYLSKPITIDTILGLTSLLLDPNTAETLARQAAQGLAEKLMISPSEIERSWPISGSFGMQVWNLDGTVGRPSEKLYEGVAESVKYSWEISALLSYGTDHMLEEGLWRRRTPQHVYNHVRTGSAFFDDHMIFVNADCCLEMGHLPAWTRERSRYRLATYGFDSSSIYVWTVGILRSAILTDLKVRYDQLVVDLTTKEAITPSERAVISKRQLRHEALFTRAITFQDWLVEARNRALDEEALRDRAESRLINAVRRAMERVDSLSQSLLRVSDEHERAKRDVLLASLAVSLAAVQVPPFVQQIRDWISRSEWSLLGIASSIILAALIVTGVAIYRYKRRR